jgi:hypothetical protein
MRERGFTLVSFLLLVAVFAAIYWAITFGPAYVELFEVGSIVHEAGNLCYRQPDDERVKDFILDRLQSNFSDDVMDHGRMVRTLRFDINRDDDIRIERSQLPPAVNIWVTYRRKVTFPFVGGEREVVLTKHTEQELSQVKW